MRIGPSNRNVHETQASSNSRFKAGDFVAFVEQGSTLTKPKILLGRVIHNVSNQQVVLLRYQCVGNSQYKLDLSTGGWTESESSLCAVKVKFTSKADIYKLLTSARTIHKSKQSD